MGREDRAEHHHGRDEFACQPMLTAKEREPREREADDSVESGDGSVGAEDFFRVFHVRSSWVAGSIRWA